MQSCIDHLVKAIFLLVGCLSQSADSATPAVDVLALNALWNATNGSSWYYYGLEENSSRIWHFDESIEDTDPCGDDWYGLYCFHSQDMDCAVDVCNVSSVSIGWNSKMVGTLPSELGNFQHLWSLTLTDSYITGTIPSELGKLSSLSNLDLSGNSLGGMIPESILSLPSVNTIVLDNNALTGSIPDAFTYSPLSALYISQNLLNGTIPRSIGILSKSLSRLYIERNCLSGPIPAELFNCSRMYYLFANDNCLTGTIPSSISNLKSVETLDFAYNKLRGSLPSEIGGMIGTGYLDLTSNSISGTIPSTIGNMSELRAVYLSANMLEGTVPDSVMLLTNVNTVILGGNSLEGSLPSEIGSMKSVSYLDFRGNLLTGPLPLSFSKLSRLSTLVLADNYLSGPLEVLEDLLALQYVEIATNFFTGPIMDSFDELELFSYLDAGSNLLSGSLPSSLFNSPSPYLSSLLLGDNMLSGSIPWDIGELTRMFQIVISNNMFTSTLPESVGAMTKMQQFDVSRNMFTGVIPCGLRAWTEIIILYLQDNQFSSICEDPSIKTLTQLQILDISKNILKGGLPTNVVSGATFLRSLAAGQNCFSSPLNDDICKASYLEVLSLDGMSSSSRCHFYQDFQSLGKRSGYIADFIGGEIPVCMFNIPTLTVLHLAGNGLIGRLPDLPSYGQSSLQNISVGNNRLTGTLPLSILRHSKLLALDVANNEFRGTFDGSDLPVDIILKAVVNRLSGMVPSHFRYLYDVDILAGNMFTCSDSLDDLTKDPSSRSYVCGSSDLDNSVITYFAVLFLFLVTIAIVLVRGVNIDSLKRCVFFDYKARGFHSIPLYMESLKLTFRSTWMIFIYYIIIWIPVVLCLKRFGPESYNTHDHQYSWYQSSLFLSDIGPSVILILLWSVSIGIFIYCLQRSSRNCAHSSLSIPLKIDNEFSLLESARDPMIENHFLTRFNLHSVLFCFLTMLGNVAVILWTNYVYVQVQQSSSESSLVSKEFSQVLLGLIKIIWTNGIMPVILSLLFRRVPTRAVLRVYVRTVVLIFNNIVCPAIVFAIVDPSCFLNLFDQADSIDQEYVVQNSTLYCSPGSLVKCAVNGFYVAQDSFPPPYVYSYQCTKSFAATYIPVFIYSNAFILIITPIVFYFLINTRHISKVAQLFPVIFWPPVGLFSLKRVLLNADAILSAVFYHTTVLLSVGLMSPALCFSVVVTISLICLQWDALIKRYVCSSFSASGLLMTGIGYSNDSSREDTNVIVSPLERPHIASGEDAEELQKARLYVEKAFSEIWPSAERSAYAILAVSALFMAALVFDMSADQNDVEKVAVLPLLVIVIPLMIYGGASFLLRELPFDTDIRGFNDYWGGVPRSATYLVCKLKASCSTCS